MSWEEIVRNWALAGFGLAAGFTTWVVRSLFANKETLSVLNMKVHKIEEDVGALREEFKEHTQDEMHNYKTLHEKLDKLLNREM